MAFCMPAQFQSLAAEVSETFYAMDKAMLACAKTCSRTIWRVVQNRVPVWVLTLCMCGAVL